MKISTTNFEGLYILETINFEDNRGSFQKLFNHEFFIDQKLCTNFKEFYYSVSRRDVIRGMHFQVPPFDHSKLVYVSQGAITDVVVDLRKNSKTYKKYLIVDLDNVSGKYIYIPKGMAHGFLSKQDGTIVNYAQTSCYKKEADCGIRYDSFGYKWSVDNPIVSERDLSFKPIKEFQTPFVH